jgi:hypothetical protein
VTSKRARTKSVLFHIPTQDLAFCTSRYVLSTCFSAPCERRKRQINPIYRIFLHSSYSGTK